MNVKLPACVVFGNTQFPAPEVAAPSAALTFVVYEETLKIIRKYVN